MPKVNVSQNVISTYSLTSDSSLMKKTKQAATDQQVVSHPTSNVLNPSASWIPDIEISAQTAVSDPNNNKNDPDAENKCENDDKCYWSIT